MRFRKYKLYSVGFLTLMTHEAEANKSFSFRLKLHPVIFFFQKLCLFTIGFGVPINQNLAWGLNSWQSTIQTWWDEGVDFDFSAFDPIQTNYTHVRYIFYHHSNFFSLANMF